MPAIARLGDPGSHGGVIISAAARSLCEGPRIARIGDIYGCPIHGPNPIVTGSAKLMVEGPLGAGPRCARVGDSTACGAVIVAGAAKSFDE